MFILLRRIALSLSFASTSLGIGQSALADTVVATVNGRPIHESTLDGRVKQATAQADGSVPAAKIREAALKQLALETLIDEKVTPVLNANPDLRGEFERQRRIGMLELYYTQQTSMVKVTPDEVADFVRKHPQFFADRKTYHFSEIHVAPADNGAVADLQRRMAALGQLDGIEPIRVESTFNWAMSPSYRLSITKRWLGPEQMVDNTYQTLSALDHGARKISVACKQQNCTILILHAAYADPADPMALQSLIARNVLALKRKDMIEGLNTALLQHADIRVSETEPARGVFTQAASAATFAAPARTRAVWVTQIVDICAALAIAVWLGTRKRKSRSVRKASPHLFRVFGKRSAIAKFLERMVTPLLDAVYGRELAIVGAIVLVALMSFGSFYVFAATEIWDHASDLPAVVGFALLVVLAAGAALRFSSALRGRLRQRRIPTVIAIIVQLVLMKAASA